MQYIEPKSWAGLDKLRALLFFVQRIEELTYRYTPDRYRSPSISIPGILQEIVGVLSRDWAEESKAKQASHLVNELRERVRGNKALSSILHMPVEKYLVVDLSDIVGSTILFRSFLSEVNEEAYLTSIVDRVISLSDNGKSKGELDLLAIEFVSTLQYLGVSRDYIHQTVQDEFFSEKPVVSAEAIKEFVRSVYPHNHKFELCFIASDSLLELGEGPLRAFGIKLSDQIDKDITPKKFPKYFQQKRSGSSQYSITVPAMDFNSAGSRAKSDIDRIYSMFQLFSHKWTCNIHPLAVVRQNCCRRDVREVHLLSNSMHYIRDQRPSMAKASLASALKARAFIGGSDRSKYLNLIEMHGLSARATSPESQIINIWTCLETISPTRAGPARGATIDRVVSNIVPISTLGYLKRIIVELLLDLMRWDRRKLAKAFRMYGEFLGTKTHARLLEIISNAEKPQSVEYLLKELGDFELLRFRLYEIATIFRSKSRVQDIVSDYEAAVSWQIHRVYRTRNSIVHSGVSPRHTKYLVEVAHGFFDQCFGFCLQLAESSSKFGTFDVCFEFADRQHKHYIEMLKGDQYLSYALWDIKVNRGKGYIFASEQRSDDGVI